MIDLQIESALTASAVAKLPQLRVNGKTKHVSQIHRYWTRGLKGIRLESVIVAGARCSSSAAVDRWLLALNGQDGTEAQPARTPARRTKSHQRAEKELASAGW